MSTVKQIRVGREGSLIDIESVNDSQHTNFATSEALGALTARVSAVETKVDAIEVSDITTLTSDVNALKQLDIQAQINALVARIVALENATPQPKPKFSEYVTEFHAGTANYGDSADHIDQTQNQDKLEISTEEENGSKYITLTGDVSELAKWLSTNPNQQDAQHKWFALDFVIDATKYAAGMKWNGSTIEDDWFDEPEGPNTITLWLKIDDVLANGKTVTLSNANGENAETFNIRVVNTFEPVTYNFTSYSSAEGGNENIWATGTVETTGETATFASIAYSEAEVKTNTIEGWVGQKFFIETSAQTDGTIYQLRNTSGELINVWVAITLAE